MNERRSCRVLKHLEVVTPWSVFQAVLLRMSLGMLGGMMLCAPVGAHSEAISELDDAASRAQYAFFTGDTRSLEEVIGVIGRLEVPESLTPMREYYAAYASWKLAQLYTDDPARPAGKSGTRGQAGKAAQGCVRHIGSALRLDPRMAEAHAIDAICSALAPGLTMTSCARSKALRTALELDPDNPRVLFIELLCSAEDGDAAFAQTEKLRTLVTAFESAPPSSPGKPDWGQAEALALLGQSYLQRGDPLAARDAIERALVIAPDYRKAQELLQAAAARPR